MDSQQKRAILKDLKRKSKSEVYDSYKMDSDDEELRKILSSRPAFDISWSHKVLHKIVAVFWTLIFITDLLALIDLYVNFDIRLVVSFAITTYFFIQIWRFNGDVFLPSIVWLGWSAINEIKDITSLSYIEPGDEIFISIAWGYIIVMGITAFPTYLIYKKVFSYYHWFRPATNGLNQTLFQESD